jgi:hypothetical protein
MIRPTPTPQRSARRASLAIGFAVLLTLTGCGSTVHVTDGDSLAPIQQSRDTGRDTGRGQPWSELAPAGPTRKADTVNGIKCETSERLAYHIHAHLAVYVDGTERIIPGDIGIFRNSCIYWLHTHDDSGIVHIESPDERVYTVGDFFAVWHQPLSNDRVGPAKGPVTAWVDGKRYDGDVADIPLELHSVIQLDVGDGAPPPDDYHFPGSL